MKKFELTSNTKIVFGRTLYQIRALISFSGVSKGDLGGWVQKESNLSHKGDCWIYENAYVFDNASVFENALVYDYARVFGDAMIYGNATVRGNARVYHNAKVYDYAVVLGNTKVCISAEVCGGAAVIGTADVLGNATVSPIVISNLEYPITITDEHIKIGCKFHSMEEWFSYNDEKILSMDGEKALSFWKYAKPILQIICAEKRGYQNE